MNEINKHDLSQMLHPAWSVDDFFVTLIDSIILNPATILSFETLYTGKKSYGVVTYRDTANMFETHAISIGGKITIEHTSQKGSTAAPEVPYKQNFAVTKVDSKSYASEKIIGIEFEDVITSQLSRSYTASRYDDELPMDMYKDMLGPVAGGLTFVDSVIGMPNAKALFSSGSTVLENLLTDFSNRGYNLVQDKNNSYVVHDDQMTCNKLKSTGEFFSTLQHYEASRFNIIDYTLGSIDYDVLKQAPSKIVTNINQELIGEKNITVKATNASPECTGKLTTGLKASDMIVGAGQKQAPGKSYANQATLSKNLKNAQTMSIWVPGWNGERLHKTVEVEIPLPKGHDTSRGDQNMSGVWEIWQYRDKIISSIFIQELFLRRAGGG